MFMDKIRVRIQVRVDVNCSVLRRVWFTIRIRVIFMDIVMIRVNLSVGVRFWLG